MKTYVFLVHGFADDNGRLTTDRLRPYLEADGLDVMEFDYGFHFAVTLRNGGWAKDLTERIINLRGGAIGESTPSVKFVGIGHSNGCAILARASHLGAPFSRLIFLNPALDSDASVGPLVDQVDVWYSPADVGLRLAKFFPWSQWGDMGAVGYTGRDPRFINHNKAAGTIPFWARSYIHLDMFLPNKLEYFGVEIAGELVTWERNSELAEWKDNV